MYSVTSLSSGRQHFHLTRRSYGAYQTIFQRGKHPAYVAIPQIVSATLGAASRGNMRATSR